MSEPSIVRRLLRRKDAEGVRVELENLLARATRVQDVTAEERAAIEARYEIDLGLWLRSDQEALFRRYLEHCLADHHMTDDEVDNLVHLKRVFEITDARARGLHDEVAARSYRIGLESRMRDHELTEEETQFLETLRNRMLLSEDYAEQLRQEVGREVFQAAELDATTDLRLSPKEDEELQALATSLGVDVSGVSNEALLKRLRLYWGLENGKLNTIEVDINLRSDEHAYLVLPGVHWQEYETSTRQVGHQTRRREPRLQAQRVLEALQDDPKDRIELETISEERLTSVGRGDLIITNRRLIFDGKEQNRTIALDDILDFDIAAEGVTIELPEGRPILLGMKARQDTLRLLLARVIRDSDRPVVRES